MIGPSDPLQAALDIRLNSLKLGPSSAAIVLQYVAKRRRGRVAFQFPGPDGDFDSLINAFGTYVNANLANLGLVAGDVTAFNAGLADWNTKFPAHITDLATAHSSRGAKDDSRRDLTVLTSDLSALIDAKPQVDDTERLAMNMTVRDLAMTPSPVPTTRPRGTVDFSQRWEHRISFTDETTPTSIRKPEGVRGVQIYHKIGGPPPVGPAETSFLANDTRSPYLAVYDASQAGETVHYLLRWENTRGEVGPWSETISASIGA